MKAHTKGFKDNISLYGRMLDTKILYEINGVQKVLDGDKIENVNIITNTDLLKTVMKQVEFQSKIKVPKGAVINVKNGVKVDDEFEYIDFGNFIVHESYWNVDINSYSHICHDNMLKTMIDYSELDVEHPIELREYINEIAKKCGLQFANINDEFVNYNVDITKDNFNNGNYTFRDVLDYVCELIGGWLVIDENDKLRIKYPTENEEIYYNKEIGNSILIDNKESNKSVIDYKIFGDSFQNKTIGSNLFNGTYQGYKYGTHIPTEPSTNIEITSYDSNNVVAKIIGNSYYEILTNTFELTPNTDYIIGFDRVDDGTGYRNYVYYINENDEYVLLQRSFTTGYKIFNFNSGETGKIAFGFGLANNNAGSTIEVSNIELVLGDTLQENYEPFTDGATPNPSYPQEILSVGDKAKNLFDKYNYNIANIYISNSNIITSAGATGGSFYIECKPNTEYIINKSNSGTNNRFCVFTTEQVPTVSNKAIDVVGTRQGEDNSTSYTIKTSNNAHYLGVFAWVGTTTPTYQEIANTLEIKENYEGYRIPINVRSENLFDGNYINAFIGGSTGDKFTTTNTTAKTAIVKCKPNTTYSIKKYESSDRFYVADYSTIPENLTSINMLSKNNNVDEIIVTTNDDANYLFIYVSTSNEQATPKMNVIEGNYFSDNYISYYNQTSNIYLNEPLRKIGKYQDYIDFKNKKVVRNVKKTTLDNSINWLTNYYGTEKRIYTLKNDIDTSMVGVLANTNLGLLMSEKYSSVTVRDMLDLKIKYGIGLSSSGYLSIVNPNFSSGNEFVDYLENNPIDLCYATSTPIEETIELPNIELSNIDNIITVDTLLKPNIELTYETNEGIPTFNGDFLKDYNINFNKKYGAINSVVFSRGLGNDNIYRKDDNSINSIGLHEIKIENNPFLEGDDRENFIQGVYDKLKGLEFYVMDVDSTGITYLDVGDYYKFNLNKKNGLKSGTVKSGIAKAQTSDSGVYKCLLLNNEILINDGLSERLYTDEPQDTYTNYKTSAPTDKSVKNAIIQVDKNAGQIVLKTNSEGKIVQVRLDADADTGSVFNVDADNINLTANDIINLIADNSINLTSKNITIDSTNFKVDKDGNMKAVNGEFEGKITSTEGEIGGFNLGLTEFKGNSNGIYNYDIYDLIKAMACTMYYLYESSTIINTCDVNEDGDINSSDYVMIKNIMNNNRENTKILTGTIKINSKDPKNNFIIESDGNTIVSMGVGGVNTTAVTTENFLCAHYESVGTTTMEGLTGVAINGHNGQITCIKNGTRTIFLETESGLISCNSLTQTSKEEHKKNFKKLENALDIVKSIDIYKYNMKFDKDTDKKRIGFVIGDDYNYSQDITSKNNDGVDIYSFVSVCCKAIQEQQEQIEQLKQEIKSLKERIDN